MPELTVKLGDQILQTHRFEGDVLSIGRSRENDIVLENLSVSREHVKIRFHNGNYILTDLNSANGTLVNGVRVSKTEIVDEDVITVGKHKLHFRHRDLQADQAEDDPAVAARTVMVEPKAEAWLVVDSGKLKGREFRLTRFETSLGKAPTNDVVLTDDWLLAKKQAIILKKGNNEFEVQDLGGLRKVKINGTPINEKADVTDGDVLELGGTRLTFRSSIIQTPTGRVPKEMPEDAHGTPEPHREAGSLNGARRNKVETRKSPAVRLPLPSGDESLDLEDGYADIKISLKDESSPTPGSVESISPPELASAVREDADEAASVSAEAADEATPQTPVASVTVPADNGQGAVEPAPQAATALPLPHSTSNGASIAAAVAAMHNGQRQPFEDKRSSGRRRRKHHQRAAQKQTVATAENGNGSTSKASSPKTQAAAAPPRQQVDLPKEKEIAMWEEALKNPSPVIKRQAAKVLKKLTGKDYEV